MNDYEIVLENKDTHNVSSKFMKDLDGFIYFYNKEDSNDIDQPVAMYAKHSIARITKKKEESKNGK